MPAKLLFSASKRVATVFLEPRRLGEVRAEAMAAIRDVSAALAEGGITHWLSYGALLGLVRDGELIARDGDIDFAAVDDGASVETIAALLLKRGLTALRYGHVEGRLGLIKIRRGSVMIDLFMVRREGDVYTEEYPLGWHRSYARGTHLVTPLAPLGIAGLDVPAPTDREAYLAHLYGPGWRTPRGWNWRFDPPNQELHIFWPHALMHGLGWLQWRSRMWRRQRRRRG